MSQKYTKSKSSQKQAACVSIDTVQQNDGLLIDSLDMSTTICLFSDSLALTLTLALAHNQAGEKGNEERERERESG